MGVLSRLFKMPSRASNSSRAGLPSRSLLVSLSRRLPPRLPILPVSGIAHGEAELDVFTGRLRQVSKQLAQQGLPNRSTIGWSPRSLSHPSQRKHFLCHTCPEVSTKPPSDLRISTGRRQAVHFPLDPPFSSKQGRQRKRVPLPVGSPSASDKLTAEGSG